MVDPFFKVTLTFFPRLICRVVPFNHLLFDHTHTLVGIQSANPDPECRNECQGVRVVLSSKGGHRTAHERGMETRRHERGWRKRDKEVGRSRMAHPSSEQRVMRRQQRKGAKVQGNRLRFFSPHTRVWWKWYGGARCGERRKTSAHAQKTRARAPSRHSCNARSYSNLQQTS